MAKRSREYGALDGKAVWKELERIEGWGYEPSRIFSDFIDLTLNSLLSLTANIGKPDLIDRLKENRLDDEYNSRYLDIVGRYKENKDREQGKRPIDYFTRAWGLLQAETHQKQKDILGEIFTSRITYGEHGQFFSPDHVTDLMAHLVGEPATQEENPQEQPKTEPERVHDPCCGSGRFLISMAKQNPNYILSGQDIDLRCCKMAALNFWMLGLEGVVRCGDSLMDKWSVAYEVRRGGFIYEHLAPAKVQSEARQPSEPQPETAETPEAGSPREEKLERQIELPL